MAFSFGLLGMILLFCAAWMGARRCDNYSLVDAVWAFGIGITGSFWLIACGTGSAKHWAAGILLAMWSMRLGWHLARRIHRAYPEEDARYTRLREIWEGRVASAFFWFFQAQALSVILLALPFLLIAVDPNDGWSITESLGLAVTLIGIAGEGLADWQMAHFKAGKPDPKQVCQVGLWYYSRHPNYFFESIIWVGFSIYASGSSWGWTTIYAPAMIVFLLLRVTGIPATEAAALLRKGAAYRRYQETTSSFIPWPPKH